MELRQINKQELDNFISAQKHSQFLQSWSWSEFQSSLSRKAGQKTTGRRVWRFGVFDNERLIASASVIEHRLPLKKSYLYCPRGPIIDSCLTDEQQEKTLKLILSKARDITIATRQSEEIFFRLEPTFNLGSWVLPARHSPEAKPMAGGGLKKTISVQPPDTLILNLTKTNEQLLADCHSKTRYNIKIAEKHGVKITKTTDFKECWPLFQQTGQRDGFNLHAKNYYQKMLELEEMELWVAENNQGDIIAANLMSFFGDTTTYLHGASDYNFRQLMAPYLLQWTVIEAAKTRGFKYYDFHGIAPQNTYHVSPRLRSGQARITYQHPWSGITRFKMGFGGEVINYPGTYDFVYEKGWYKLYQFFRKMNRLL